MKTPKHTRLISLSILFLTLLPVAVTQAQPSSANSISFQGALTSGTGQPLANGNYSLTFKFYDVPVGGVALATSNVPNVPVIGGIASIPVPVDAATFNGQTRFLGITVNGAPELTPRVLLTAVPYAISAGKLGNGIFVSAQGNLGMGTSTPNEKLSVAGNIEFQSEDGRFHRAAQIKTTTGLDGTTDLGFWTREAGDNAERLIVRGNGNVGIGTSTPSRRLDVNGDAIIGHYDRNLNSGLTLRGRSEALGRDSHAELRFDFGPLGADIQGFKTVEGGTALAFRTTATVGDPQREVVIYEGRVGVNTPTPATTLEVNGTTRTTVLQITSDRAAKEQFESVNPRAMLERLVALPLSTWAYTNNPKAKHIGPIAQDFHGAFGFGDSDKHIATVDLDGVALAAIQGLHQVVMEQETTIRVREDEVQNLNRRVEKLERLIKELVAPRQETTK